MPELLVELLSTATYLTPLLAGMNALHRLGGGLGAKLRHR